MSLISIIIPCYNEQPTVPLIYQALLEIKPQVSDQYQFDYWFIDDGSSDETLAAIKQLAASDTSVHYISFSRNFGKEAALLAGLQAAKGDLVAVMDSDLQDPPALLPKMIELLEQDDYDCIGTQRVDRRGEPPIRSFFAKVFYRIINRISNTNFISGVRDFRLMKRQMVDAILELQESNRFSKGIFSWVGFKTLYLPYENQDRAAGKTSWSFWQLFNYSLEGIVDFSEAPLTIASFVGVLSTLIATLALIFIVIRAALFGDQTNGWPSLVSIILFIGGIQLFCLGIVGKYIGKIYLETKRRPQYIVKEKK